ncbi:MAG: hypothetical protein WCA39_05445 [Nitrososphaeraceae archaeon]
MLAGVHVGNSGLVGELVCEHSEQLIDLISKLKKMDWVDRVVFICRQKAQYACCPEPNN